jgi:carbon-monoxide dehydrogenase medium subunit
MRDLREYLRPASAEEAVSIKRRYGDKAVYLGGGSDLLVHRPRQVEVAIDIRHAGLGRVRQNGGYLIGGAALLRDVEREAGAAGGGMFREAVRDTAPWLIRNAATLAGNIANASPAADSVPALLALDAQLALLGEREELVDLADVFEGPHRTSLGDRLITEIRIPPRAAARQAAFIKLARSKSDIAQVNVAVSLLRDGDVVREVRIALGAVAPTPMRARGAERLLEGRAPTDELLREVETAVRDEVRPISDWRASEEYRRRTSGVLVGRALQRALADGGRSGEA